MNDGIPKGPQAGAYRKGRRARLDGVGRATCPYQHRQTCHGGTTWSFTFIRAWRQGWDDMDRELKEARP